MKVDLTVEPDVALSRVDDLGLYLGSCLLTAAGLTLIKLLVPDLFGVELRSLQPVTLLTLAGAAVVYFAGLGLWLLAMGRNQLSTSYPIGIGLSLVSATLAAGLVLHEHIGLTKILGIGFILAGAILLTRAKA